MASRQSSLIRRTLIFCVAPIVLCLAPIAVPLRAQAPWIMDWLRDYAQGRGDAAAARMSAIADIRRLELDLDRVVGPWRSAIVATPEIRRRALAAFVLDAVNARLDQGVRATRLLEWSCRQIRRHNPPDDFDRQWHRAALALFAGAVDPDGLESHVAHVREQFPDDPRLLFARAVASELRAAPFLTGARATPAGAAKHYGEAASRYREAIAAVDGTTKRLALLRLARVEIELGRPDTAIATLAARETDGETDADLDTRYLAHLFRGLALDRLKRTDEARAAFDAALGVVPQAQSAVLANAALLFRQGQRDLVDRQISALLDRPTAASDPWWLYWPGDYRHAAAHLAAARRAIVPASPEARAQGAVGEGGASAATPGRPLPPGAGAQTGGGQPLFRSSVTGVSVSVSVLASGVPVTGLSSSEFELLDNGVPQKIGVFSVERQPVDVSLLLDLSGSVQGARLQRLKSSVVETSRLLGPEDRLRLVAVQHQVLQVFGFQPAGVTPALDRLTAGGGTALADALAAGMMRAALPDRRHLIVAYTDGADTISILSPGVVQEVAGFADALVHVVVPLEPDRRKAAASSATPAWLGDVVARTGGQLFTVDSQAPITGAFARAIDEFRTSYVLRYLPTGVKASGWHDITVRVKGGPYEVRARKGYSGR